MPTQVLILAAGRGSRLGPRTAETPKPLLQVGPHTLIEHQLEMFAEAGVGPVGMVVGYQADEIEEIVGIRAEYIPNARWSTTNSLYSFLQARPWVRGDLIIANCDILLHPGILAKLLNAGGDCFAYDSTSGHGLEHMKVMLDGKYLARMSKTLDAEEVSGENVGLLYLTADSVQKLFDIAERRVNGDGAKDWLGVAVQEMAQDRKLRGVDIAGLPWAEIDFAFDLNRARKEVWPAIRGRRSFARSRAFRVSVAAAAAAMLTMGMLRMPLPAPPAAPLVEWQMVRATGADEITIEGADGQQRWWLLPSGGAIEADLSTALATRVETRALLAAHHESVSYRLEISMESGTTDWRQYEGHARGNARHQGRLVTAPAYHTVERDQLPGRIRIEGSAAGGEPILIRIREAETVFGDESPSEAPHATPAVASGRPLKALVARSLAFAAPRLASSTHAPVNHVHQP
jgi:L-glutamine-phosphate cytidylyltransferase